MPHTEQAQRLASRSNPRAAIALYEQALELDRSRTDLLGKLAEHLISKQNRRNLESSMENIKHMLEA